VLLRYCRNDFEMASVASIITAVLSSSTNDQGCLNSVRTQLDNMAVSGMILCMHWYICSQQKMASHCGALGSNACQICVGRGSTLAGTYFFWFSLSFPLQLSFHRCSTLNCYCMVALIKLHIITSLVLNVGFISWLALCFFTDMAANS
jgi:hypothetical protein